MRARAVSRDPRLLGVLAAALVAVIVAWAAETEPSPAKASVPPAVSVPITATTLVCPQAGGMPIAGAARIAYADADPSPASAGASSLTTAPLDPDGVSTDVELRPGRAWVIDGPTTVGPVRVMLDGPATSTSAVAQFTRQLIDGTLQVSATPCEAPTTDAWFAGFASGVGAHATLLLSNVDAVPATVDVGIYGDNAPPNNDADHGLVVAPQSQVAVRLDTLAPGFANMVTHVTATAGRVVPAIRYDMENGSIPLGVEWVPRTEAPALTQTVPGFVAGDGDRRLVLADPGDLDASVSLRLVTADGSFTPIGYDAVTVPAGGVVSVDLGSALGQEAGAVVATSTVPVVAAGVATLPLNARGGSDLGFTAAAPALSGPAVVAGGETGADRHTTVLLSAPDADARLDVTLLGSGADSAPLTSSITVPGGTTMELDLGTLSADAAPGIELAPGDGGPVYAAFTMQETNATSTDLTSFPVRAQPRELRRPAVRADLTAGLAGQVATPTPTPPASPSAPPGPSDLPSDFPSDFPSDLPSDFADLPSDQGSPPVSPSQPSP